jgi:hypothetical protein
MATTTTRQSGDRITRAASIIRRVGSIERWADDRKSVQSEFGGSIYDTRPHRCTCPDHRRTQGICKHMLAAYAPQLVALALKMRAAYSLAELRDVATFYAAAITDLPLGYRQIARDEYRRACDRIVSRITFAEVA